MLAKMLCKQRVDYRTMFSIQAILLVCIGSLDGIYRRAANFAWKLLNQIGQVLRIASYGCIKSLRIWSVSQSNACLYWISIYTRIPEIVLLIWNARSTLMVQSMARCMNMARSNVNKITHNLVATYQMPKRRFNTFNKSHITHSDGSVYIGTWPV